MHAGASTMSVMPNRPPRAAAHEAVSSLGPEVPALAAIGGARVPLEETGVRLWRVPLRGGEDALAALIELLPADERSRMDAIQDAANKRRFAVARGALRLLLAHHLLEHPRNLVFAVGAHGKPYLPDVPLEFNLSHSHDLALIAVSLSGAVGVDVERRARRPRELQAMARRVLSLPEQEWLARRPQAQRNGAFLRLWTCKEAVSKAAGSGFSAGFSGICIEPQRLSPERPQDVEAGGSTWRLRTLVLGSVYVGALAVAAALPARGDPAAPDELKRGGR